MLYLQIGRRIGQTESRGVPCRRERVQIVLRAHLHVAPADLSRLVTDPFDAFFDEAFFLDNPLRTIGCSWSSFQMCVPESGTRHFVQGFSDLIDFNPIWPRGVDTPKPLGTKPRPC